MVDKKEAKQEVKETKEEKIEPTIDMVRQEKIKEIFTKKAKAIRLNEEETKLYEEVIQEAQQMQVEQHRQAYTQEYLNQQLEIQKEALNTPKEEILESNVKGVKFYSGPSKIQQWISRFFIEQTIAKGKKKGGTYIFKGYRDTGIELVWSPKPVRFVKFTIFNEKNEPLEYVTRVVKTKHRLKGTSIPVHVALEGVNENVDLFEGAEVELSAEYVNKALTLQWNAGLLTGLAMRDEEVKDIFKKIQPFLLIIILLLVCVMAYMMYSMFQKIDALDIGAIKSFLEVAKATTAAASNVTVQVV